MPSANTTWQRIDEKKQINAHKYSSCTEQEVRVEKQEEQENNKKREGQEGREEQDEGDEVDELDE